MRLVVESAGDVVDVSSSPSLGSAVLIAGGLTHRSITFVPA
jgi:hypothetical protein